MKNKFTVIIPTRERCDTLYHAIRSCLNQTYDNYELLISDNFSQDDTEKVVASFNDSRLKYVNTGKRCSMSENFDFALAQVTDGYLMFIGDDDGILPNSLEYVNDIINETNCEAVVSHNAFYTWPSLSGAGSSLNWGTRIGYEVRDSKEWIRKYLTFKMQYTFDLPGAYCGFVHRGVFGRVTRGDSFFRSPTPDSYSALAVAFATDNYVYSHEAFAVHGASARSNGAAFLSKAKGEEGQEVELFFKENIIPFHRDVVFTKAFRVSSIEAFLHFSDVFPELTQNYVINWKRFLQYTLTEASDETRQEIVEAVMKMCEMHNVDFNEIKDFKAGRFHDLSLREMLQKSLRKVTRLFNRKTSRIECVTDYGVYNIHDAVLLMRFYLMKEYR